MERMDWKSNFRLNFLMLKVLGLWPPGDELYGHSFYTLYASIVTAIFQVGHIFFQTVNLYFIRDDLQAVTGTIFILLSKTAVTLKSYCVFKNMKMLKQLMTTIESDQFQPKNNTQKKLIQPTIAAWKMTFWAFLILNIACLFFWSFFPIFDKTFKEFRLPFLAWYPYNYKTSPQYEFTYLYQVVATHVLAAANVSNDALIAALNMFVAAQFEILCDDLRNLRQGDQENSMDMTKKLKTRINHHREILKFADQANEFYNWLLFVQFFVGGVSIGLAMFQLTVVSLLTLSSVLPIDCSFIEVVPFSSEFFSHVSYANAISVEVFMYCWFGNDIEFKSSKLPYAVFECDWTGWSPEVKKNLIIFALRVQRSLQISALGLFYLNLDTFVRILRTAWSYFALLRQVNTPA
ncbi:7tm 6 domain containing protein [Asbolus verrucosus]|uniref:Odorant receptor n=1 Tax=Asbolus verrucosus TaxID=1661398 RepID=A0A482VZ08_ASBVE|nr:7tm 6 domain containing protein [Asbolus verrucosus]